ncbi:MAG: hypothetical protein COB53_11730 [Elusimicrobia bacterium]|nr:MAG: hypothetical protein COB53_11730 [Elusimicrobiota bacterium]
MKAVLVGATGLVGRHCLKRLLSDFRTTKVTVFARRKSDIVHEKLDWRVVDMEAPEPFSSDEFYCCLGTTIKKAGSREAFRRIDLEMPLAWGRAARQGRVPRTMLVSSVGAELGSSNFYLSTKGEIERAFSDLRLPFLGIFRPSLLLGARNETRLLEGIGQVGARVLSPFLLGSLSKYRAIDAGTVALGMVRAARGLDSKTCIYHYDDMMVLVGDAR